MDVKICIHEKTYHNLLTLTKPANVSPFINAITNLLDENMTFVDYEDESVTE
jgi:hypothetical protein